jgi:hypothetical protein
MNLGLLTLVILCGLSSAPAAADVTAVFANNQGWQIVIEAAADGPMRIRQSSRGNFEAGYMLIRGGKYYEVSPGPGGPVAISADASDYLFRQGVSRGEIILSDKSHRSLHKPELVKQEQVQIAGYTGTRYSLANGLAESVVVSEAPELKPLGKAIDYLFAQMDSRGHESGLAAFRPLVASRGVLSFFNELSLAQVSFESIDPSRFALPGNVTELSDVIDPSVEGQAGQPDQEHQDIVKGAYRNKALYLLDDSGAMQVWSEDSRTGRPFKVPGSVLSFCLIDKNLWAATKGKRGESVMLWTRKLPSQSGPDGGEWQRVGSFARNGGNEAVVLDCSGMEPVLVAGNRAIMPVSGKVVELAGQMSPHPAFVVSHVQDGILWLGFNSGEWGGGLHRVRLSDGMVDRPSDIDSASPCGGRLNPSCDPVTGLAPDPTDPKCVLATIGLVHMMSHGSVVRVCGNDVSVIYAKPYTLDPNWRWAGKVDEHNLGSVAFHSLAPARTGSRAFAVASDGVYQFVGPTEPNFAPFQRQRIGAIDWSNPEYVLVRTQMNQRHSLSGGSYLLIPR